MPTFTPDQSRFLSKVFNNSKVFNTMYSKSPSNALKLKQEILNIELINSPISELSKEAISLLHSASGELHRDLKSIFPDIK